MCFSGAWLSTLCVDIGSVTVLQVIFTAGLCHLSYGELDSDFEPSLNKTLWLLHNLTTASHARVIVKTNESPWRHNGWSCNVARTIVANHVLMKLVRM